jgi:hypothetical protein
MHRDGHNRFQRNGLRGLISIATVNYAMMAKTCGGPIRVAVHTPRDVEAGFLLRGQADIAMRIAEVTSNGDRMRPSLVRFDAKTDGGRAKRAVEVEGLRRRL